MTRHYVFLLLTLLIVTFTSITAHMYSTSLGIHQLTIQNFDMIIQRPNQAFIVQFFNKNEESHQLFSEYVKIPNLADKQVQVGVVDATDPQNKPLLTRYKITSFPSIKIFIGHVSAHEAAKIARIKPIDYIDRMKTARSILNFALESIPNNVIQLWTAKDEAKLVAEGSNLPRALLFTDKKSSNHHTLFKSAALNLGSRMQFMEIRKNERKLFDKYDIGSQLPILIVVPPQPAKGASTKSSEPIPGETQRQREVREAEEREEDVGDEEGVATIIYDGTWNSYPALLTWLTKYAAPEVVIESSGQAAAGAGGSGWDPSQPSAATPRTPGDDLGYLSDQSCLKAYCLDTSQLCAILIINENNENADAWRTKFRTLELSVKPQMASMFRFVWLDGEAQTYFLNSAFGLTPQEYPQVVVLAGKKNRWAPYVGAFDAAGITEFLDGIMHGRTRTQALKSNSVPNLQGDSERCPPSTTSTPSTPETTSESTIPTSTRSDLPLPIPAGEAGVVLPITGEDVWETQVKPSKQPWMVAFTASWNDESKALLPEWMSAGRRMRNMVRFGYVECGATDNAVCQRFGVTDFPTIKTFDAATDKIVSVAVDYKGEKTADALMSAASKLIKPKNVRKITSDSLVQWIGENPTQVRVLLFHSDEKLPEYFQALSQHFNGYIGFGATKHTEQGLIKQFQVKEMPAIYILRVGGEKDKATGEQKLEATFYNGAISFSGLSTFLQRVLELGGKITEGATPMGTSSTQSESTKPASKPASKPAAKEAKKEETKASKPAKAAEKKKTKETAKPAKKAKKDEL